MEFKVQPWGHQLTAIDNAKELLEYALFFEMGTGKTATTINILRHKFATAGRLLRTLVLCPPIVIRNWREEWISHSFVDSKSIVPLLGSGVKRLRDFGRVVGAGDSAEPAPGAIFITNYEALLMPDLYEAILRWGPEAIVFDESHYLKDKKSRRTKLAHKLSKGTNYRYLLSGTPVLNSPLDLFTQFQIMDHGQTFGNNFFAYRGRYFHDKNAGMPQGRYFPKWEIRPGSLEEINRLLAARSMRVTKDEVMDLPPLIKTTRFVGMTSEQARLYKEMKSHLVAYLNDKACVATLAITKALRLQQIASGYIKTTDQEETTLDGNPKQAALKELLEEITPHSKVLVWACWKQNYAQIRAVCEELGVEYVEVHGERTDTQKAEAVRRFNTEGSVRVLVGHPRSGGIGVNLVAAAYSIVYSKSFSSGDDRQAESRNHRGGSEIHDKITRIDLVTEGTIDELVTKKLAEKIEISDKLLDTLKQALEEQDA